MTARMVGSTTQVICIKAYGQNLLVVLRTCFACLSQHHWTRNVKIGTRATSKHSSVVFVPEWSLTNFSLLAFSVKTGRSMVSGSSGAASITSEHGGPAHTSQAALHDHCKVPDASVHSELVAKFENSSESRPSDMHALAWNCIASLPVLLAVLYIVSTSALEPAFEQPTTCVFACKQHVTYSLHQQLVVPEHHILMEVGQQRYTHWLSLLFHAKLCSLMTWSVLST